METTDVEKKKRRKIDSIRIILKFIILKYFITFHIIQTERKEKLKISSMKWNGFYHILFHSILF